MRRAIVTVLVCAIGAFCSLPIAGQGAVTPKTPTRIQKNQPPKTAAAQVPLKPFTANFHVTTTSTSAAHGAVTREEDELIARDSQERRVVATTPVAAQGAAAPVTHVSLYDPVARTNSSWSIPGKQVTVTPFPQPGARTNCNPSASHGQPPKPTIEELGKQTIQGIETDGRRITVAVPATAKQPAMTRVTEEWTATDPGLRGFVARESMDEEPTFKTSRELQNFSEGDPNPAYFQPPADYQVVNKPAPGTNCPATQGTPSQFAPIAPPPPA